MEAALVTTLPPGATATLDNGEVVVLTDPAWSVEVMTAAGAMVEVMTVWPLLLVVVTGTATLVSAEFWKALVVRTVVRPSVSVEVTCTGTRTPV